MSWLSLLLVLVTDKASNIASVQRKLAQQTVSQMMQRAWLNLHLHAMVNKASMCGVQTKLAWWQQDSGHAHLTPVRAVYATDFMPKESKQQGQCTLARVDPVLSLDLVLGILALTPKAVQMISHGLT